MSPRVRKVMLFVHLVCSVGWIGAVIAYLALDVAAVGENADMARAALVSMDLSARYAILPLGIAALLTGLVMSLGTAWGLFRHYWTLISFVLTTFALLVLIGHLADIGGMAMAGAASASSANTTAHATAGAAHGSDPSRGIRGDFLHAGGGLAVLLFVAVLNVFKPKGLTPYGWRVLRH